MPHPSSVRILPAALALVAAGLAVPSAAGEEGPVSPPKRITFFAPRYPDRLRAARIEGACVLEMLVSESGNVSRVRPLKISPGGEGFIDPSVDAVCRWRYRPATLNGQPIPTTVTAVVHFSMDDQRGAREEPSEAVPPADAEARDCPPPRDLAAPEASPPAARGVRGPPVIDLASGGPAPLELGASLEQAAAALEGAARRETEAGEVVLTARDLGIEATLAPDASGAATVRSIRYIFEDRRDGFTASPYRTAAGLGKGKLCLGIAPAHGMPSSRRDAAGPGGHLITTIGYAFDGSRALFTCVDRWIVELTIEAGEEADPAP